MKKLEYLIIVIIAFQLTTSCSFQKRTYRKGYYVQWKSNAIKKDKFTTHANNQPVAKSKETKEDEHLLASSDKNFFVKAKNPVKDSTKNVDCGDSLWLKTGMVANVTIIEENEIEVKYKLCDNLDGPLSVVPKSNVERIKYAFEIVDCNDSLWFKNWGVVRIKVISDKEPYIKYKRCDDVNSRTYKILMEDVKEIKYANGEVYFYKRTESMQSDKGSHLPASNRSHRSFVLGIISSIFCLIGLGISIIETVFFVFIPLSIVAGIMGITSGSKAVNASKNRQDRNSRNLSSLGIVLSVLAIICSILLIFISLSAITIM